MTTSTATFVTDVDRYRLAIRDWLADQHESLVVPPAGTGAARIADGLALTRRLWQAGWKRYGWPAEVGGFGGGPRHRAVYYDELCRSGFEFPDTDLSIEVIAPAVLRFAPELARAYLPAFLGGEEAWAQAFSEPDAGSDLGALRTRGAVEGSAVVVRGQKVWTSHGHHAARLLTLVRTGTSESRHRGLAALLIDADSPGLTRRPLVFANGADEMCETFFDDVRVPADRMVGDQSQGWQVAMFMLQYERSMYAAQRQAWLWLKLRRLLTHLEEVGADRDIDVLVGAAWLQLQTVRARSIENVRRLAAGAAIGPEASADKVLLARAEQSIFELCRRADRDGFPFEDVAEPWRAGWWYSRACSIFGGAGEIQRSIIADRVLALPDAKGRR